MGYVPGFEWDIFLSFPMEVKPWTEQFERDISADLLLAAIKRELKIYFAPRQREVGDVSDEMFEAAGASAVFIAILTKDSLADIEAAFLRSQLQAFTGGGSFKGRICLIHLHPAEPSRIAEALSIHDAQAFWNAQLFFYEDDIPLLLARDTESKPGLYNRTVGKVAHRLRERLDALRGGSAKSPNRDGFSGIRVFLARTPPRSVVEHERQDIRTFLLKNGATLVSDGAYADDAAALQHADLFVQLFSTADSLDIARRQFELAEGRNIQIVQWRKEIANSKTDSAILQSLDKEDKRLCRGANTDLFETFKVTLAKEMIRAKMTAFHDVAKLTRVGIGDDRGRVRRQVAPKESAKRENVFISYRRDDAQYQARDFYQELSKVLPAENIFMDIDSIPLGVDFVHVLMESINQCQIILVLIGRDWINAIDATSNQRRLENVNDLVRVEIREGLKRGIPVVPILLDHAPMPDRNHLPEDIRKLVDLNAESLKFQTFRADAARLINKLGLAR
jgi:TIR domain